MDSESIKIETTSGIKFVAILLILGGILGIGLGVWLGFIALEQAPITIIIAIIFILIFIFCTYHGFGLWRGNLSSLKWAMIIFAAQIPIISLSGFSYEFYTGLMLSIMGGEGVDLINLTFGSSLNLYFSPEITETYYGINIVAIIILIYLLSYKNNEV